MWEKGGVTKNIGGGKVKMNLTVQWETRYYRPFRQLQALALEPTVSKQNYFEGSETITIHAACRPVAAFSYSPESLAAP